MEISDRTAYEDEHGSGWYGQAMMTQSRLYGFGILHSHMPACYYGSADTVRDINFWVCMSLVMYNIVSLCIYFQSRRRLCMCISCLQSTSEVKNNYSRNSHVARHHLPIKRVCTFNWEVGF